MLPGKQRGAGVGSNGRERAIQVSDVTELGNAQILFSTLRTIDAAGHGDGQPELRL